MEGGGWRVEGEARARAKGKGKGKGKDVKQNVRASMQWKQWSANDSLVTVEGVGK